MKIEVPLSPYEEKTPTTCENSHTRSTTGRKATPYRVKKINTDTNSPSLRSFRLDRAPLSDIGNAESTVVTESVGPKAAPDLISLTPLDIKSHKENTTESTPTLVTGSAKKSCRVKKSVGNDVIDLLSFDERFPTHNDDDVSQDEKTIQQLREQIRCLELELTNSKEEGHKVNDSEEDSLRRELSELKDFIVEMDSEKRRLEKMLMEEKGERIRLEKQIAAIEEKSGRAFALKESAMQSRISSLQAMLQMVSLEKDRLVQYTMMENNLAEMNTPRHKSR